MSSAVDEDGRQLRGDVLRDPEHVPRVNGAIGKDDVGDIGGYVFASVISVGVVHGLKNG